jgi:integrase
VQWRCIKKQFYPAAPSNQTLTIQVGIMASIYKRKNANGTTVWRAVIRIKGYPTACRHDERKQVVVDWAQDAERKIKAGQFKFAQHNQIHTFSELLDRFLQDEALEHHRSSDDTHRHLLYWKSLLGDFGLVHITSDRIGKERQLLSDTPTSKGHKRSNATTNRYMSSLSSLLTYAAKTLNWISENPVLRLTKLKEGPGRDRVLSQEEISRLLSAAKESKSPYLYCVILLSLTTGARQGELLNLEWKHIDFENKIAYIKETKNGHPRSIALCDPVIEELKKLYQNRSPHKPLVFASKTAFGRIDIKKAWQQALKRANIINCRAHDMRHTFCTLAATKGASNLQLQTATGHRTLSMLVHYTHMDVEVTKQYTNQISEQILKGDSL